MLSLVRITVTIDDDHSALLDLLDEGRAVDDVR